MFSSVQLTEGSIVLRPFHFDDSRQLYQAVRESLADLKPWMTWAHNAYSQHEADEFVRITRARWEEKTLFAFAIIDADNGDVLGGCSLSHKHPVYRFCNVGYWVRSSRHGEGIAGRAAKLAVRFGFEHTGLVRAEIVIAMGNKRSIRVAEKIGAHYEGILLNRMVVDTSIFDAHMYSLLPSDFGLVARL